MRLTMIAAAAAALAVVPTAALPAQERSGTAHAAPTALAVQSAPPAPARAPVTREWLIGRWTDNGDCSVVTQFLADGRFIAPNGRGGTWSLDGGRLTFQGAQTVTLQIARVDANTLFATLPDGTGGPSTRC